MIPPARTAATTAAEVQPARRAVPDRRGSGGDVSTARPAGTATASVPGAVPRATEAAAGAAQAMTEASTGLQPEVTLVATSGKRRRAAPACERFPALTRPNVQPRAPARNKLP